VAIDPNGITWDPQPGSANGISWDPVAAPAARAPSFGDVLWDDDVAGPPRASFENVQSGVTRTAMTPAQASGEVPLPSDWQGQQPPAAAPQPMSLRDVIANSDPFAQVTNSAPVQNFADNFQTSELGRGAIERLNRANAFAAKLEAVPGIVWDSAESAITGKPTTAAQDALFRAAENSERTADANALRPNAGFFETLAHGAGGLAVDLPMMIATDGGSAAVPATEAAAPTAARVVGNALEHSARVSTLPASVNATDTAQRVLDRGGSGAEATRAALGSAGADILANAAPLAIEGGPLTRLLAGGVTGADTAQVASQIRNATLPEDMRSQPSAGDLGVGAVQGAALGAVLGPRASRGPLDQLRDVRAREAQGPGRETASAVLDRAAQRAATEGAPEAPAEAPAAPTTVPAKAVVETAAKRLGELDARTDLSPAETEERDFLREHANDPATLADAMGVTLDRSAPPPAEEPVLVGVDRGEGRSARLEPSADWRAEIAAHPDLPDDTRSTLLDRFEQAHRAKPIFDHALTGIAAELNLPDPILAPVKGTARSIEKTMGEYEGDALRLKDLVRGTLVVRTPEEAARALQAIRDRFGEVAVKDRMIAPDARPLSTGYRDVNVLVTIGGRPVEIQINTPQMLAAKDITHKLYEKQRALDALEAKRPLTDAEKADRAALVEQQKAIYARAWDAFRSASNLSGETFSNEPGLSADEALSKSATESSPTDLSNGSPQFVNRGGPLPKYDASRNFPDADLNRATGQSQSYSSNSEPGGGLAGSEAGRGARTAAIGSTSSESVPQRGSEWVAFPKDSGTLGVPRSEMPQIKRNDRDDFIRFLASKGIDGESTELPARSLKPTQAEFSPEMVERFAKSGPMDGSRDVLVSSDGYILDGHHQWVAHRETGTDVPVIRLNAPIRDLLKVADEFPAVQRSEGATQPARAPLKPRAEGRRSEAFTASNEAIPFRYALVDASDLVPSNHPDGRVNPAYPQELQPRDRTSAESRTQVQQIAGNLQPERLGESADIVNGAPLVGPDGIVESGNGRVMALASAPAERRNAYRRWLRSNAERFGIDPKAVDGVRAPVLVRVREGELPMAERARLGQEGNRGTQQAMNPTEIARADARVIDDDMMGLFQPSEDGDVLGPSNQAFLREFARRIGGMEAAGLSADGRWTKQMADRVNAAVFWRAYGDERLLHAFAAEADPNMKSILNALGAGARDFALARSSGAREAGLDAGALFADAMTLLRDARERGMSVRALLDQGDMFGGGADPAVTRMATWLADNARSYRRLGESLVEMGRSIRAELEGRGSGDMFGRQDRGLREIADETVRQHEARNRPPAQSGLFTAGGKPRPADAGSDRTSEPHGVGRAAADAVPERVANKGASRDESAEAELEGPGHAARGGSKRRRAAAGDDGKTARARGRARRDVPREDGGDARAAGPDEHTEVKEGAAAYGETHEVPSGAERRDVADTAGVLAGRRSTAVPPSQLDLFSPEGRQTPRRAIARLAQSVKVVATGSFRSGIERIRSWHDAAHIIAPLRKSPQEQFFAVVADADGKPLAVLRHTIGGIDRASVFQGTVFGAIAQIPGAKHVWFAHNHPSGRVEQGAADRAITDKLNSLMRGSGIETHGMIVVAPNSRTASLYHVEHDAFGGNSSGASPGEPVTAAPRRGEVPLMERAIRRVAGNGGTVLSSPEKAIEYAKGLGESGVILLDNQHRTVGFLPMTNAEMARLRTGDTATGAAHVARTLSEGNAAATIVVASDAASAKNVAALLRRLDARNLDSIILRAGESPRSLAKEGFGARVSDDFYSRSHSADGTTPDALRAELHASSLGTPLRALERTGVLRIIDDPAQDFAGRWDGQHAVLNAARIPEGDGFAIALHELGIHRERDAGLRGMLGNDVFNAIVRHLRELEKTTAPVLREAREVIAEARARIDAADTPAHQRDEELVAYAAEGAARRLAAGSKSGALRDLVDRLASRVRAWLATSPIGRALVKRGFALKVTPDDLVHIAVAAVKRQAREAARGEAPTSEADALAADARYSKPVALTAGQEGALAKIGVTGRRESPREMFRRLTENAGKRLTQGIVDQFAPLKDLDQTAYMQARLSKGTDGALEAAFLHGTPKLTDGALDIDVDGKGLRGILAELDGEHDLFFAWLAGNRAEKLKGEGRERLFTDDDIAALKSLNQGKMTNGRLRGIAYAKAHEAFKRYQKAVLDIAEEAGLIDGESRSAWESEFYVPFYRLAEDDPSAFVPGKVGSGLVRQQAFKKLKGGKQALNDLLGNTLANWSNLLTSSMRNMAAAKALAAAEKAGIAEKIGSAEKGSVWISDKGQQVHYRIEDPLVLDALTALNYTGIKGPAMDAARWFKHALTTGVTISPTFRIRNLLRDTLSTLAVSDDAGFNPLKNIVDGWKGTKHGSATDIKLLAGGGKVRFGSLNDGQQAEHAKRLIKEGVKDSQILDSDDKIRNALSAAWDWWKETGDRSETINRAAVYQNAIKAGKSHLEASYEARDLLDFTMGGKWAAVRLFTGVVPFMNARIQGIYKLGKSARGNPLRFAAVTGAVALASALNYLLQKDDDDFKALPDWARDTYWCTKLGDKMLYIPKPFEIGALGTVVERGTELALSKGDYKAEDFATSIMGIIGDQLSMNPIPQFVKPAMEAAFNYDLFQGRPIDSMGDERLPPGDRVGPTTSAGAVALGRAVGVSPKRIEHLARGYFGWLGTQALNASDWALRDAMDLPANPRRDLTDVDNTFLLGDFLKDARGSSDKYVNRFYRAQDQIDQTYAAYSLAKKTGDEERERELEQSRDLALRPTYAAANKRMSKLNQQIKAIANDREMSAREKRLQLDELYAERAELARETDEEARATP
jgi:hypothetical protein